MCGVYYAFFGILFIFITGIIGTLNEKNNLYIKKSIFSISLIFIVVLINLAPNIIYRIMQGSNNEVGIRSAVESDIYGLRMTQLLIPMWGHKSETLANFGRRFHDNVMVTEATSSALGFTASAGFLILVAVIFIGSIAQRINVNAPISYSNSKRALNVFAKYHASTLASRKIRVNVINPGHILTETGVWDKKRIDAPESFNDFIEENIPIGSIGKVGEIAEAVFFCADSPNRNFIVGASIDVDGGTSLIK
jgi:hypothetical protein